MLNLRNNKILIIVITLVLAILLVILILYFIIDDNKNNLPDEISSAEIESNTELNGNIDSTLKRVDNRNNYYIVRNCIFKYFSYNSIDSVENNSKEYTSEYLYSLLDAEYINFKNITKDNILDIVDPVKYSDIIINDMYVSQRSYDISVYFVYGELKNESDIIPFSIMVKIDRDNSTFKLLLDDYVSEKYQYINEGEGIDIEQIDSINNDTYNVYDYKNISDETYMRDIFNQIRYYIINDNERLYSILEQNYKSNYSDYQKFYDYITSIYMNLITMSYGSYDKENNNGKSNYMLFDNNEKFLINVYEEDPFYYTVSIEKLK